MLSGGVEVLIGVVQEPVFGPLVVFGLGGVATEVLGDHAARLTPLTDTDADDLIHGVHAAPLLFGHRGTPPVDTAALADVLLRVSRLAGDLPEVAELDLNPVIATSGGAQAVDARVRVTPALRRTVRLVRRDARAAEEPPALGAGVPRGGSPSVAPPPASAGGGDRMAAGPARERARGGRRRSGACAGPDRAQ